jgi:cell division cycle 14
MASMQVQPSTPSRVSQSNRRLASNGQTFTPPNADRQQNSPRRAALGEITNNEQAGANQYTSEDVKPSRVADENLPAPTPGQPRKTSKLYSTRKMMAENQPFDVKPESEIITMQRSVGPIDNNSESEEEQTLRALAARKSSQSPHHNALTRSGKRRAISCTTTTTTTTKWDGLTDTSDGENAHRSSIDELELPMEERMSSPTRAPKTPGGGARSGNGVGMLSIGKRSSPSRRSTEGKTSVRKTSGRVGSMGAQPLSRSTRGL